MSSISADNRLGGASRFILINLVLTNANTEYPQPIPVNTRLLSFKPRNIGHTIKYSWTEGMSGIEYITLTGDTSWSNMVGLSGQTLYFQSPDAGAVVEIEIGV